MKFLSALILTVALCCGASLAEGGRKPLKNPKPIYPAMARTMNLHGSVTVQLTVSPAGKVTETRVLGGHPVLAESAVDTVKTWVFEPSASTTTEVIRVDFN